MLDRSGGDACCVGVAPVKRWLTGGCVAVRYGSGADLPQGNAAHTQRLVCEAYVSAQAFFYLEFLPGQSVRDF